MFKYYTSLKRLYIKTVVYNHIIFGWDYMYKKKKKTLTHEKNFSKWIKVDNYFFTINPEICGFIGKGGVEEIEQQRRVENGIRCYWMGSP